MLFQTSAFPSQVCSKNQFFANFSSVWFCIEAYRLFDRTVGKRSPLFGMQDGSATHCQRFLGTTWMLAMTKMMFDDIMKCFVETERRIKVYSITSHFQNQGHSFSLVAVHCRLRPWDRVCEFCKFTLWVEM